MGNRRRNLKIYGLFFVLFVLLAVVIFRCSLGPDNAFSASDANIGQIAAGRPAMGALFGPSYGGYILGGIRSARFTPHSALQAVLSPYLFNDLYAPFALVLSSFLLLIFLRLRQRSWGASFFGAVSAFWLGSATLASAGHYGKLGAACFFAAALVLIEKSVQSKGVRRICWATLCGASVGLMLLSQQDIGLLFGVTLAPYALFRLVQTSSRKPLEWAQLLVPIALVGVMIAAGTALSSYQANVVQASSVNESEERTWNFVTQWSQPPQEVPDLLAPGFMGWKTGDPVAPYWGKTGQSADWPKTGQGFKNFRLDSVYLGLVPFLLSLAFLFSRKGRSGDSPNRGAQIFWWSMALLLLILAFGKFTPVYRLVIQLPLFGSIRAPIKFLHNLGIVFGILSAYGFDAVVADGKTRMVAGRWAVGVGVCFFIFGIGLLSGGTWLEGHFSAWGMAAPLIIKRMMFSSFYAAVSCGLFSLILWKTSTIRSVMLLSGLMCLFPLVDSFYLTQHYFHSEDLAELKRGNVVVNYLKEKQAHQRVFTFQRDGIYNRWIAVDFPLHGVKGFWFWQAPRLSQDYKDYLAGANQNVVALLQSTSVRYALAPAGAVRQLSTEVFKPVFYYRFGLDPNKKLVVQSMGEPSADQDQVVLELKKTLPRVSLFYKWQTVVPEQMIHELFSAGHDVMEQVLVDADLPASTGSGFDEPTSVEWTTRSVKVQVSSEKDGVLLFTQRFQPEWKAYVDGEEATVFRWNGLSLGVYVPAGATEVVFEATGQKTGGIILVLGLIGVMIAGGVLVLSRGRG